MLVSGRVGNKFTENKQVKLSSSGLRDADTSGIFVGNDGTSFLLAGPIPFPYFKRFWIGSGTRE